MILHSIARRTGLVAFAVGAFLLVPMPVRGQATPAQQDEIKAVVRISKRLIDVRLELWLRSTTAAAQALEKLTRHPLAKNLLNKYLETTLPELAALADNRSVDAVGSWLVISIGAPKAK